MIYLLTAYFIILTAAIIVFNIYAVWAVVSSKWGKYPPFVPSIGYRKNFIINEVSTLLKSAEHSMTVVDPGSGCGSLIIPLARQFPQHRFIGIEWSRPLYLYCKRKGTTLPNIEFICMDLFDYDFANADIIVCFLIPKMARRFANKIKTEIQDNCQIYSNGIAFSGMDVLKCSNVEQDLFRNQVFVMRRKVLK